MSKSKLLDQGIITFTGLGDVLVMIFTDCVMYVRCDLIDGKFAQFNPEDWLKVEERRFNVETLVPISEHRRQVRTLLMIDYAHKLYQVN